MPRSLGEREECESTGAGPVQPPRGGVVGAGGRAWDPGLKRPGAPAQREEVPSPSAASPRAPRPLCARIVTRGEPPLCAPQDSPWGGVRDAGALAPSRRGGTWAVGFPGLGRLTPSGRDGGERRATCARKPRAERPPPRWRSRAPSAASAKAPCQASASPSVKPKRNSVLPPCGPRTGI